MPFTFESTRIPEILIIENSRFSDDRGYFCESFRTQDCIDAGLPPFVQENHSFSKPGTIRGLHYQLNPQPQGKLVYCVGGKIIDYAVDIRENSPTYGEYVQIQLGTQSFMRMVYIPPGFAHGFQALTPAHVIYKVTDYWSPEHERCIRWNDPDMGIEWASGAPLMSEKDMEAPLLSEAENNFVY